MRKNKTASIVFMVFLFLTNSGTGGVIDNKKKKDEEEL